MSATGNENTNRDATGSPNGSGNGNERAPALPLVAFRPDIVWTLHSDQSRWVARDPLTARFFYFSDVEHDAACLLDGIRPLPTVLQYLRERFPHFDLSLTWLMSLVTRLNAAHLLLPASQDTAKRLLRTQQAARQRTLLQLLAAPLSIRIPLFDPRPALNFLSPVANILFARTTVFLAVSCAVLAVFSIVGQWLVEPNLFQLDPRLWQGDRWLLFLGTYAVVKSLHELGHGLACVRWRTDCREWGLMFLFFTPCLYCDTTDAWRLSSRWQRAAISAAGIYVELILATLAAWVWLFTHEGLVHSLAANVILICSVGTIVINGNPFLRYDGYYICSDVWGVPNLSEQGREASMLLFVETMTGQRQDTSHLDRNVWLLAGYQLISFFYRTFISVMILWVAWQLLVPLGLGFLAVMVISGTVLSMSFGIIRFCKRMHHLVLSHEAFKFSRLVLLLVILFVAAAFVSQVPLPVYVRARGLTDMCEKQPIFAPEDCQLIQIAQAGQAIKPGDPLARFDSPLRRFELIKLHGEITQLKNKIEQLKQLSSIDRNASFEIPTTEKLLAERESKARLLADETDKLTPIAQKHGSVYPAIHLVQPALASDTRSVQPVSDLEEIRLGSWLARGTLVGYLVTSPDVEVSCLVSQDEIERVQVGMPADCQWDSQVNSPVRGKVVRVSPDPVEQTPDELVGDPRLLSLRNEHGKFAPLSPHYTVTVRFARSDLSRIKGSLATVQIPVASEPLLTRLIHAVRLSFKPVN